MRKKTIPLNVQCFSEHFDTSALLGTEQPKLLYAGKTSPSASAHPRIMHTHENFLEILLVAEGSADFFIHDRMHHVEAGDLLLYQDGIVHDETPVPETVVCTCCLAVTDLQLPGLKRNCIAPAEKGYIFHCGEEFSEIQMLFEMIYANTVKGNAFAKCVSENLMNAVLCKIISIVDSSPELPEDTFSSSREICSRVKRFIDSNYMKALSLPEISSALNINQFYLAHKFKEISGYSPIQYANRRRIGEAQTLLITTDLSILEISERVGFDTQSHFNIQFTKYIGMAPRQFRHSYVVGEPDDGKGCHQLLKEL